MSTKVEIVLQKQAKGQKWKALEGSAEDVNLAERPVSAAPVAPVSQGPSYPSSSRTGPKDWDKLANNLTTKPSKSKKKDDTEAKSDESDNDSADSEYGDSTDAFFKKLYAGADPDTQRAMMKSYVVSNGTSLSTNWSEVGNKKIEPYPES